MSGQEHADPLDPRNFKPRRVTREKAEEAEKDDAPEFDPLPPGDYLVKVVDVTGRKKNPQNRKSYVEASIRMEVVEPEEFKGRLIFDRIPMPMDDEPDTVEARRLKIWRSLNVVEKGDRNGLANYDPRNLKDETIVFRHTIRFYSQDGDDGSPEWKMTSDAGDFVGFHAASWWYDEEKCKPAPQPWIPKDMRKVPQSELGRHAAFLNSFLPEDSRIATLEDEGGIDSEPDADTSDGDVSDDEVAL